MRPSQPQLAHPALDSAPGNIQALATQLQLQPHFPGPIDAAVLRVHPDDVPLQLFVATDPP
jgi:hypothetical protein